MRQGSECYTPRDSHAPSFTHNPQVEKTRFFSRIITLSHCSQESLIFFLISMNWVITKIWNSFQWKTNFCTSTFFAERKQCLSSLTQTHEWREFSVCLKIRLKPQGMTDSTKKLEFSKTRKKNKPSRYSCGRSVPVTMIVDFEGKVLLPRGDFALWWSQRGDGAFKGQRLSKVKGQQHRHD